jgi:hypothetical protein
VTDAATLTEGNQALRYRVKGGKAIRSPLQIGLRRSPFPNSHQRSQCLSDGVPMTDSARKIVRFFS